MLDIDVDRRASADSVAKAAHHFRKLADQARKAEKETQFKLTISERGDYNDANVKSTTLEQHTVTLEAQRKKQEEDKLAITQKKKDMKERLYAYSVRRTSETSKRAALEQTLRKLIIDNARLKELNTEHSDARIRALADRDKHRQDYIENLLERNAAITYRDKMKAGFDAEVASRKSIQAALRVVEEKALELEFKRAKCENEDRIFRRELAELNKKNADLSAHCY